MPGLVGHDFGDAIRFGANYVAEDSREYEKAGCSMELFSAFTRGFLSQTRDTLTTDEIRTLPLSVFTLAVELASRFLDDYLLGNVYFRTEPSKGVFPNLPSWVRRFSDCGVRASSFG